MNILTLLSPLSAWLVMLSLGLGSGPTGWSSWRHELTASYWLGIYVFPLLLIMILALSANLPLAAATGFALCVLSGSGTSGVAWARAQGASGSRITARLASGAAVALVTMPLAAAAGVVSTDAVRVGITVFAALLLAQWLPWQMGRWWAVHRSITPSTLRLMQRLASLSVMALIVVIAWQAWPLLIQNPRLALMGTALAALLGVASVFEADAKLEAMGVVRNLTLVTLVLMQSNAAGEAMAALAAFGAAMYPVAWLASKAGALIRAAKPSPGQA